MPHCRTKKVHNITVISEPGGDYVDHSETGESGLAMANYLYEVIVETESKESLLAMGSGKFNNFNRYLVIPTCVVWVTQLGGLGFSGGDS